jgi:hypothetical protein
MRLLQQNLDAVSRVLNLNPTAAEIERVVRVKTK